MILSTAELAALDALYAARGAHDRPNQWDGLVEALRRIRRTVESGTAVEIEGGPTLHTWQDFYAWAHGRYHALEDGADHWIGDDAS